MSGKNLFRRRVPKRSGVSIVIGTLIFLLILMLGLTTITTIFGYYNNYNNQLLQHDHSVQQEEQTSLGISQLVFGASPNTVTTSTGSASSYVPVTLNNSQTSPTGATFQQNILFNPSSYSSSEATNLGNIRFCLDPNCGTQLYAWLESCTPSCTNSATSASVWVKLTSSIGASGGTLIIYMVFQPTSSNFDGIYWGEAPNLSGVFGQYDNGAQVFTYYNNGESIAGFSGVQNGGTLSLSTVINPFGSGTPVISMTGQGSTGTSSETLAWLTSPITGNNFVAEGWININTNLNGLFAFRGASNTALTNYIAGDGWSGGEASVAYETGATNTILGTNGARSAGWYWNQVIVSGTTYTSTVYSTLPSNGGSSLATTTVTDSTLPTSNAYIGLATWSGSTSPAYFFTWRIRVNPPNGIMPSVSLGSMNTAGGTGSGYSFERKVIFSQGLWWAFYSDGTRIGYSTSADGSVWSSENILTSSSDSTRGYNFNIWISGSTFYYVLDAAKQSASFFWRYGTLQSIGGRGNISWVINQTSVSTKNIVNSYNSIVTDSSGNVWVALNTNDGISAHIEIWKYSSGLGWKNKDDISPLASDITPILVPLSNGVALIYGEGGVTSSVKIVTTTTGANWTSSVSPASNYMLFSSSATAIGNTLYFVGLASGSSGVTTGTVDFWSFANGATSTSAETLLQNYTSGWIASISEEPSRTLIVFYGSGITLSTCYSTNFGNSWSPPVSSFETSIAGLSSTYGGSGAIWTSGSSSPFNIRFASLPVITTANTSPFAVHLISLYIYNTVSYNMTHYDTNSLATGVTGSFDFEIGPSEQMSIPLTLFPWTTNQNYLVTIATDQGVLESSALESPN